MLDLRDEEARNQAVRLKKTREILEIQTTRQQQKVRDESFRLNDIVSRDYAVKPKGERKIHSVSGLAARFPRSEKD